MSDANSTIPYRKQALAKVRRWEAVILHSSDPQQIDAAFPLTGSWGVGREAGAGVDLVVADGHLSRRHLTFTRTDSGVEVVDHDTTNGTFVEGKRVDRFSIEEPSIVRAGETLFEVAPVETRGKSIPDDPLIVGRSGPIKELLATIRKVASSELSILILGETGVGKELVATRIHQESGRTGELVAVNCGAIPENLVESTLFGHKKGAFTGATDDRTGLLPQAAGGTLFLDEIGELPITLQPKLLRAIENREFTPVGSSKAQKFDGRWVAATHVSLQEAIEDKRFRADLYARLNDFTIQVPPLRERRRDIPLLVRHVLAEVSGQAQPLRLTGEFVEALLLYDWPMNVRQLRSVVKRAALAEADGEELRREHLPPEVLEAPSSIELFTGEPNAEQLAELLRDHKGKVAQLARAIGRPRSQVYRWLKRYELDPEEFRAG